MYGRIRVLAGSIPLLPWLLKILLVQHGFLNQP